MGDDMGWKEVEWLYQVPRGMGLCGNQRNVSFEVLYLTAHSVP